VLLEFIGVGSDSGERSTRVQVGTSDSQRLDVKNQQENIQWHPRYASLLHCSIYSILHWKFLANIFIVGCFNKLECEL